MIKQWSKFETEFWNDDEIEGSGSEEIKAEEVKLDSQDDSKN